MGRKPKVQAKVKPVRKQVVVPHSERKHKCVTIPNEVFDELQELAINESRTYGSQIHVMCVLYRKWLQKKGDK